MQTTILRSTVLALLAFLCSCGTIAYRQVQGAFAEAVAADNSWSVSPFGINAAAGLYETVRAELTDDYIANLDKRLQTNAWLLRAVSEWRTGAYLLARQSAAKGSKLVTQQGSRDQVMLMMIDGLVIDSDLRDRFQALPSNGPMDQKVDLAMFTDPFHREFVIAIEALDNGFAQKGRGGDPDLEWYYRYQRWRLMVNLRSVANDVDDIADADPAKDRKQANRDALQAVNEANRKLDSGWTDATKIGDALDAESQRIPADHPLRQLIEVLSR